MKEFRKKLMKEGARFIYLLLAGLLTVIWGLTAADVSAQTHFTSCFDTTGSSANVAIPDDAVMVHSAGYFTLDTNDEIAVFRPDGSICAGVLVWPADGSNQAITVWGDNDQTVPVDGLMDGDVMLWRVWDASENNAYAVLVNYVTENGILHPNGEYGDGRLYALADFTPTVVSLADFSVDGSWSMGWLALVGIAVIMGSAVLLGRRLSFKKG